MIVPTLTAELDPECPKKTRRVFTKDDDSPASPRRVILSHGYWQAGSAAQAMRSRCPARYLASGPSRIESRRCRTLQSGT